jgi:hypothetical protein
LSPYKYKNRGSEQFSIISNLKINQMNQKRSGAITSSIVAAPPSEENSNLKEIIKVHDVGRISNEMLEKTLLRGNGQYLITFLCGCEVLPFDDFKVYKTRDYTGFSRLLENRELDERHVHTLMESFMKDGYLFTIVYVNEKMEIIDGQHRFEGARRKHLPIYFIVMPGWGIKEVTVMNVNSRNWTMEDFLNTHAKAGKPSYIAFKEFYDKHEFDITTAQILILGRRTHGGATDDFRSGKMDINEAQMTKAYIKGKRIRDMKDFHPHGWKSRNFVEAMITLLNTKGYDHNHLVSQMKKYPISMLEDARSLRTEEYLDMLVDKYNYRKKDKIEIV